MCYGGYLYRMAVVNLCFSRFFCQIHVYSHVQKTSKSYPSMMQHHAVPPRPVAVSYVSRNSTMCFLCASLHTPNRRQTGHRYLSCRAQSQDRTACHISDRSNVACPGSLSTAGCRLICMDDDSRCSLRAEMISCHRGDSFLCLHCCICEDDCW